MIRFLEPFFDALERQVFDTRRAPDSFRREAAIESIRARFPGGEIFFDTKGEAAIQRIAAVLEMEHGRRLDIAVPSVLCGSVLRAVQPAGRVRLMDADLTWNAVVDRPALEADVLLFAGLGGKRAAAPKRGRPDQILIDDSCQCFDGVSGLRPDTDFSVFSFGAGKQMHAGGGAIIWSGKRRLRELSGFGTPELPDWQLFLMASQLQKIETINARRRANGLYLIEKLSSLPWLRLPAADDHVFLKFTLFIDRGGKPCLDAVRSKDHFAFGEHMARHGVEVEDSYVPLHVRFPERFPEPRYRDFAANRLWTEAITIPCRPQLDRADLDRIVAAIRAFRPEKSVPCIAAPETKLDADAAIWNSAYTPAMLDRPPQNDYFGKLFDTKLDLVRAVGRGKRILDVGSGSGAPALTLAKEGFDVTGVDVAPNMVEASRRAAVSLGLPSAFIEADACRLPFAAATFDVAYSFSTLSYLKETDRAIAEIARVLKPGGTAILDLGNRRSLNDIEARHVSTGARSYHLRPSAMRRAFAAAGLSVAEHRSFQLAPLWAGRSASSIAANQELKPLLAETVEGRMVDEIIASDPAFSPFAFRHLFLLRKDGANAATSRTAPELPEPRLLETVLGWAARFEGDEEKRFVARMRRLVERAARRRALRAAALTLDFALPDLDGMQTERRLRFLYESVTRNARRTSGRALEIGCYKGSSTVVLAKACLALGIDRVRAVDLFTGTPSWGQTFDTFADAKKRLTSYGLGAAVELVRGDSRTIPWTESFDVLHIDGDHAYEGVAGDIRRFAPLLEPGGIIVFDDYDLAHPGVVRAVDEFLAANPEFETVAVHDDGPSGGSLCARRTAGRPLVLSAN